MADPYEELGQQLRQTADPYQKLGLVLQLHPAEGPDQHPDNVGAAAANAAGGIVSAVAQHAVGSSPATPDSGDALAPPSQLPDFLKPPPPPKLPNPIDSLLKPPPSFNDLFPPPQQPAKPKNNLPHLEEEDFKKMWPTASPDLIKAIVEQQDGIFQKYGITTRNRLLQFLAQISFESNEGKEVAGEDMRYYTPKRLGEVDGMWQHINPEQRKLYGYIPGKQKANVEMIAKLAYGGRMGNRPGTWDGWTYRGRGLLQTTGREDYIRLGNKIGVNLVDHPERLGDPKYALEIAAADFAKSVAKMDDSDKHISALDAADSGNTYYVTKAVNGGLNGLAERKAWLKRWKTYLKNR
ncbi:MAG TPA: hypothetical protein VHE55_11110 [Fimbriimonadaceae bacterium]|nr:hypothetical protein [Fimbriimonadaceae bacterium]